MVRVGPLLLVALAISACDEAGEDWAAVTPEERLPGGSGTNTLLLGSNAFGSPLPTLTAEHDSAFFSGNSFFTQAWVQAPASTTARDGLGPIFNARSCGACHAKDGRGRPPLEPGEEVLGLLFRVSLPGAESDEAPIPHPVYGDQLQPFAIDAVAGEVTPRVATEEVRGVYDDGTPYALLRPVYTFEDPQYGPLPDDLEISPRVAPQVIGLGMLEAIDAADILAWVDAEDADEDGISGRAQMVIEPRSGAFMLGRFGWKGDAPTVEAQVAGAFLGDMGLTSSVRMDDVCSEAQVECREGVTGGEPEVDDVVLRHVVDYSRFLAVPIRVRWDDAEVRRGKALFMRAGCDGCHRPSYMTGEIEGYPELSGERIYPYTDLLLHDMGEALADQRPVFAASGSEWKTPPLWGIGHIPIVNRHDRLMHDGRARGLAEAILWHGGEATAARDAFKAMTATDRAALEAFVGSL